MELRRILLGVIGAVMLVTALFTYFTVDSADSNEFFVGVCSKVGVVLLTIFLAWPVLQRHIDRMPAIVSGGLLIVILFAAIRPKLFPLIIAGIVITLAVHFGLRFASTRMDGR